MTIKQLYQKHINKLDQNKFIYAIRVAYDLLSDKEQRIYQLGFEAGVQESEKTKDPLLNYVPPVPSKIANNPEIFQEICKLVCNYFKILVRRRSSVKRNVIIWSCILVLVILIYSVNL